MLNFSKATIYQLSLVIKEESNQTIKESAAIELHNRYVEVKYL